MSPRLKREAVLLAALLGLGVLGLPFAVYLVGIRIIGEYAPGADALTLATDIWAALADGHWAAWVLVTSPYLVVQAARATAALWRGRRAVTPVTDPQPQARNWRL